MDVAIPERVSTYVYDECNRLTKINEFYKVEVMRYSHEV